MGEPKMFKKLSLFVLTALLAVTVCIAPVFAEPEESGEGESVSSISSVESDGEHENTSSTSSVVSHNNSVSSKSSSKPQGGGNYIKDDSAYYASINSIGDVESKTMAGTDDGSSTVSSPSSVADKTNSSRITSKLKIGLWISVALVAVCVLILVSLNRVYKLKYEAIDPAAKKKKRSASGNGNRGHISDHRDHNPNHSHRPRD